MLDIDYHSHLIPGVDDGSRGGPETVRMGLALAELGVRRLHLTPHRYRRRWGMDPDEVARRTDGVRRLFDRAEIEIELVPSSEHYFGHRLIDALERDDALATFPWAVPDDDLELAVLIEIPTDQPVVAVGALAGRLRDRGIRAVMAHPERTKSLERDDQRMLRWRDAGWRFQLDLMSLVGAYGRGAVALSERWCAEGRYDVVGSDLHRPSQIDMLRRAHTRWRALREET